MALINEIFTIKNTIFSSNTYLLKNRNDNTCVIIDPGLDTPAIENALNETGSTPLAILATHGHFDHIGSVQYFKDKFQIPFFLHEKDLKLSKSANFYLKLARIDLQIKTPVPDEMFTGEKNHSDIGNFSFDVYNFPGHSEGSCIIKSDEKLFSGDIIYKKGLGFNNFPGESKDKLKKSIVQIMDYFEDSSLMLPGHGESALLGVIKRNNTELINFIGA